MPNKTITVIVPVYNTAAYLRQCVDSILAQTYENLEILLLNDGSTDDSPEIMHEYEQMDERVRVIDKPNEGYGATCNRGIEEATGHWIAIVEPDDWLLPGMYADMVAFAESFEERELIDVVKTPYWRVIDPDTPKQQIINCSYHKRVKPKSQPFTIHDDTDLIMHHPSIWSALYRRGFLNERGIRFMPIPGAGWADNPFLIETLCQAERIVYLDKPYYCYREETEEKTRQTAEKNTLLPLDRWQDMTDVLERIGMDDPKVLRAHYQRGFTYLGGIMGYVPLTRDDVLESVIRMCDRMQPELVLKNPFLPPADKRIFAAVRGLPEPKDIGVIYGLATVERGLYFLRNVGPKYTWKMTRRVISRMRGSRLEGTWRPADID